MKNMVQNFHTIGDGIVRDTFWSLASSPIEGSYIGGGMSLQLTLPSSLHRLTSDIDLDINRRISYDDFKLYTTALFQPQIERGYSLTTQRKHQTLDAHLERDEQHLVVQMPRRNVTNFLVQGEITHRELEHTRKVPYNKKELTVIAYEDLTARKLVRSTTFMQFYSLNFPKVKNLEEMKTDLDELKASFDRDHLSEEPQEVARQLANMRLYADIFDIRAMQENFGAIFDTKYLTQALDSFEQEGEKRTSWNKLFDKISR